MTDAPHVHRVLGDQPFAEIRRPVWAVTDARHDCVIAAGDLGHVIWRGTGQWLGHRIGVTEPPGEQGEAVARVLFSLRCDPASALQPWHGPAVELPGTLVHAGRSYRQGAAYAETARARTS
ncbi:hypothetical protein [Streptomyces sp. NPDC054756]